MSVLNRPHREEILQGNTPHGRNVIANAQAAPTSATTPKLRGSYGTEDYEGWDEIRRVIAAGEVDTSYDGVELTEEQAIRLARMYRDGEVSDENREQALEAMKFFDKYHPGVLKDTLDRDKAVLENAESSEGKDVDPEQTAENQQHQNARYIGPLGQAEFAIDVLTAAPDLAKTFAGSAFAEVVGGAMGAVNLIAGTGIDLFQKGSEYSSKDWHNRVNSATETIEGVQEGMHFLTQPWTDSGARALETVAAPMMKLDSGVRDISEIAAGGNPELATTFYSTVMGGMNFIGLKGVQRLRPGKVLDENLAKMQKIADDMGIKLTQSEMIDSITRVATNKSSHRAANAGELRDALIAARTQSRKVREQVAINAQGAHAAVAAGDVAALGKALNQQLRAAGYVVDDMPAVKNALQSLENIETVSPLHGPRAKAGAEKAAAALEESNLILPDHLKSTITKEAAEQVAARAAGLDEIWAIRNTIEKNMGNEARLSRLPDGVNQNKALRAIDREIDNYLDHAYMNDMVSGSSEAIGAWRLADDARVHHNRRFNEDKAINKLMDLEADPTEIRAALVGMSATAPKQQAVRTVNRIKEILGSDSPAFRGITTDYVHELVQPLLRDGGPNLKGFIDNYDKLVTNNRGLVKALGIDETGLKELRNFAHVARQLPQSSPFLTPEFISTAIARFAFGHGIAKAGMRVSIWKRIIATMSGQDAVTQKQILMEAAGTAYGTPAISKASEIGYSVARNAVLADIVGSQEKQQQ